MRKRFSPPPLLFAAILFLAAACSAAPHGTLTQFSTIDALLSGCYDGRMPCRELLRLGDLGIGTFDRLDGEMVLLDGKVYQVRADGAVSLPGPDMKTPFAAVVKFEPQKSIPIPKGTDFHGLEEIVNRAVSNENIFCAVRVKGRFARLKARSVPAQSKPYLPLVEVTKTQPVFEYENISGVLVGFRCPAFVKGVNVPGFHLHFLSEDHSKGGHLLECVVEEATAEIETCNRFTMILPENDAAFGKADLGADRSKDLQKVEQ
jgi:acetolactate decarboxylase